MTSSIFTVGVRHSIWWVVFALIKCHESVFLEEISFDLNRWLREKQEFANKKGGIIWNVIGPEGGWSPTEIDFFNENNNTFVKLSDTILRTSTASINASSILNQWRIDLKSVN